MKLIKKLKRWGIYQLNHKEVLEYGFYYAVIHPDNMECFNTPADTDIEVDSVSQAEIWIDNY